MSDAADTRLTILRLDLWDVYDVFMNTVSVSQKQRLDTGSRSQVRIIRNEHDGNILSALTSCNAHGISTLIQWSGGASVWIDRQVMNRDMGRKVSIRLHTIANRVALDRTRAGLTWIQQQVRRLNLQIHTTTGWGQGRHWNEGRERTSSKRRRDVREYWKLTTIKTRVPTRRTWTITITWTMTMTTISIRRSIDELYEWHVSITVPHRKIRWSSKICLKWLKDYQRSKKRTRLRCSASSYESDLESCWMMISIRSDSD